jgi:oxalate decarboxylase/phosphoglucose isomerase-like protein (cupin superfamily)
MQSTKVFKKPHLIEFKKFGSSDIGYISVAENEGLVPFKIERIFWTYYTPEEVVRGRHAHYNTEQVLIAVAGRIVVTTENPKGEMETFVLEKPNVGVYVPPDCWHTMQYSHSSVQLVYASSKYDEKDYIRSYDDFKKHYASK